MKQAIDKLKAPTPPFFKKLRNISLVLVAVGTAVLTAPIALPATIVTVAGYLTVAGSVASAVSQLTAESQKKQTKKRAVHAEQ
jgi:hypothetical protein